MSIIYIFLFSFCCGFLSAAVQHQISVHFVIYFIFAQKFCLNTSNPTNKRMRFAFPSFFFSALFGLLNSSRSLLLSTATDYDMQHFVLDKLQKKICLIRIWILLCLFVVLHSPFAERYQNQIIISFSSFCWNRKGKVIVIDDADRILYSQEFHVLLIIFCYLQIQIDFGCHEIWERIFSVVAFNKCLLTMANNTNRNTKS